MRHNFFFLRRQTVHPLKRFSLLVGVGVILASALINAFPLQNSVNALPTTQATCEAQKGVWSGNICVISPTVQAQQWGYLNGLVDCVSRTTSQLFGNGGEIDTSAWPYAGDRINEGHFFAAKWFNMNGTASYVNGDNEADSSDCNTILQKGLASWGYSSSDYKSLFCQFVPFRANSSSCATGSGDFGVINGRAPSILKIISQHLYGTNSPPKPSDAMLYSLNLAAFQATNGCSAKESNSASGNFAYTGVPIVDPTTGKSTLTDFEGKDHGTQVYVYLTSNGNSDGSTQTYISCSAIAANIKKYAPAYQTWVKAHPTVKDNPTPGQCANGATTDANGNPCTTTEKSSCGIQGIGWFVCPVLTFLATINDGAFNFLSSTFLETKADVLANPSVQSAWSIMRNLANVAFVIAFLFIIFSQLTGQGVSNYGVKKLLPRLVIAAILVNVSFFICQIAVDISNILGYSLNGVLANSYAQIGGDVSGGDASGNGFGWAAIVVSVLAGGAALLLAITIPVLLAVLVALLMIVLILVGRTALIILLTVIAPLAFVAFLLPNTEQWYKKWYKMYFALLMVFPIIAVVFGASTLAAGVIKDASKDNVFMQVVAIGVAALPLFVVPSLLKGSLNAAGTIGTRLSGVSSKLNGKINGKVKETSKLGQLQKYTAQQRQIRRSKILGGVDPRKGGAANPLNWGARVGKTFNESRVSGQFGDRASQMGEALAKEEFEKLVKEASIGMATMSFGETKILATTGKTSEGRKVSEVTRAAAIDKMMSAGGFNDRRSVLEAMASSKSSGSPDSTTRELRSRAVAAAYAKGDANIYGTTFGDQIVQEDGKINSDKDLAQTAINNIAKGSLSSEHAVQGEGSTDYLVKEVLKNTEAAKASGDAEAIEAAETAQAKFIAAADLARASANTRSKINSAIDMSFERLGSKATGDAGAGPNPGPSTAGGNSGPRPDSGPNPTPPGPSTSTPNDDNAFFVNHEGTTTRGDDGPSTAPPTPPQPPQSPLVMPTGNFAADHAKPTTTDDDTSPKP
jgi:hypothetical protein